MNYDITTFMGIHADEYLFSYHQTYENGPYHCIYFGVPILGHGPVGDYPEVATHRVSLAPYSAFRTFYRQDDTQLESIMLPPVSTYFICTSATYEATLRQFIAAIYDKVTACPVLTNICKSYSPELYI